MIDRPADGVLRLAISNPSKRNALDHAILAAITDELTALDAGTRCVIVTGRDGMFSSGYDISEITRENFAEEAEKLVAHPFCAALAALDADDVPTLAVLAGSAIGGGLELALTCDLRLTSEHIKLGMPPARLGLIYSHTGLRRFIQAIGAPRTRELFLRGRNIDVERALEWGLVNEVAPAGELVGVALEYAAEVAANAPLSLEGNKRVMRALRARPLSREVEQELIQLRESCFRSEDFSEGVQAFAEKRKPVWRGR